MADRKLKMDECKYRVIDGLVLTNERTYYSRKLVPTPRYAANWKLEGPNAPVILSGGEEPATRHLIREEPRQAARISNSKSVQLSYDIPLPTFWIYTCEFTAAIN